MSYESFRQGLSVTLESVGFSPISIIFLGGRGGGVGVLSLHCHP